jgi:DNA-binding XRE family transcriptional regulator
MRFARELLEESRVLAGMSRPVLAARAGITAQALRNIEAGASVPRPTTANALAFALGMPARELWITEERAA